MTWLGEIGKICRDSVENFRENMNLRSKFCVCVSILDAATDLSGCSHSGSLSSALEENGSQECGNNGNKFCCKSLTRIFLACFAGVFLHLLDSV